MGRFSLLFGVVLMMPNIWGAQSACFPGDWGWKIKARWHTGLARQSDLTAAIEEQSESRIKYLLDIKADVNQEDLDGCRPLVKAITCDVKSPIVELLCERIANVTTYIELYSLLEVAARKDNADSARILMEHSRGELSVKPGTLSAVSCLIAAMSHCKPSMSLECNIFDSARSYYCIEIEKLTAVLHAQDGPTHRLPLPLVSIIIQYLAQELPKSAISRFGKVPVKAQV